MILTVTLNVAIDKRYVVERFDYGQVMRVKSCNYTAGGKGLNVSRIARLLGEEVLATGFIGGHAGAYVVESLDAFGIHGDFTRVQGETRSCVNLFDESTGVATELLEPGICVPQGKVDEFLHTLNSLLDGRPVVCISGSAPRGVPVSIYPRMVEMARSRGCPVLLDASGENLRRGVEALPDLVKPNRDELRDLLGGDAPAGDALVEAARTLHRRGIGTVVISLGDQGALAVCGEGVFKGSTPQIPVVNTVGCGDSMVGAFAFAMSRNMGAEEGFRLALAVSTANALSKETGYFRQEDLDRLLHQVRVEKLPG